MAKYISLCTEKATLIYNTALNIYKNKKKEMSSCTCENHVTAIVFFQIETLTFQKYSRHI